MFGRSIYFDNVTVLDAAGVAGHSLRVKGGRVVAIDGLPDRRDCIIDGLGGWLVPGLINAHDHLELNTFKRLRYRERYGHAVEWFEDIEARFDTDPDLIEPRRQPLDQRLFIGALKNLLSGVTTVCHHNPLYRQLRHNFPIRVVKSYGYCHSLFRGEEPGQGYKQTKPSDPWIIHLAEGVGSRAADEFDELQVREAFGENTVLVHGVGLTTAQRRLLAAHGGGLVWCPGSNFFMFGRTATVKELALARKLALGSDSRLSGEFDLLAELIVAARSGQLSARQLFRAVTVDAARVLRLREGGRGQIKVRGAADLVLLPPSTGPDPFECLLELERARLELVMLAGKPLVGSGRLHAVFETASTRFDRVILDRVEKLMARKLVSCLKRSPVQEPGLVVT